METNTIEVKAGFGHLTKNFIRAGYNFLHEPMDYIEVWNKRIAVGHPEYIGISQGKAMQRMDFMNFVKDVNKSINFAKIKVENGKKSSSE